MSRKDFIALARIVADLKADHAVRRELAERLAALCRAANPRFDLTRFLRACGVQE